MSTERSSDGGAEFRVHLVKEQLVFSAAHFITFAGNICERLHGHNYGVRAEVAGPLDENRYVIDFIAFRDALALIVAKLDHRVLLPDSHHQIRVEAVGKEIIARFEDRRWVFPADDCVLLPVKNTTAEEIAHWIADQLRHEMKPRVGNRLRWLEVGVDENNGQWGICRIDW